MAVQITGLGDVSGTERRTFAANCRPAFSVKRVRTPEFHDTTGGAESAIN